MNFKVYDDWGNARQCMRFNGGKNNVGKPIEYKIQMSEISIFNGLRVELSHPSSDLNFVYIDNIGEQPSFFRADYFMNNKAAASISLHRISENKLGYPYNNCISKNEYSKNEMVKLTQKFNNIYKHDKCLYLCFFKRVADTYNCSFPGIYTKSSTNCSSKLNIEIMVQSFKFKENCKRCPFECDLVYYNMNINNDYNTNISNDTYKFYIYYKSLKFTLLTQVAKTYVSDLVAQVGGTLGFFIGFRILSTIEILQFILESLIIIIKKFKKCLTNKPLNK